VSWLRRLVAGLLPRKTGFDHRSVLVGFLVDEVALVQVFSEYFGFPQCSILIHSSITDATADVKDDIFVHLLHETSREGLKYT
jgi:hypothetical protein